jgi:hypothetical protein
VEEFFWGENVEIISPSNLTSGIRPSNTESDRELHHDLIDGPRETRGHCFR